MIHSLEGLLKHLNLHPEGGLGVLNRHLQQSEAHLVEVTERPSGLSLKACGFQGLDDACTELVFPFTAEHYHGAVRALWQGHRDRWLQLNLVAFAQCPNCLGFDTAFFIPKASAVALHCVNCSHLEVQLGDLTENEMKEALEREFRGS